jgi:hypothetical protein
MIQMYTLVFVGAMSVVLVVAKCMSVVHEPWHDSHTPLHLHGSHTRHHSPTRQRMTAYAFLSYGREICPAIVAAAMCRQLTRHDREVVIVRVGDPLPAHMLPAGVKQRIVPQARNKGKYQWIHTFAKFWPSQWYEYETVVVMDTDVLLLNSLDSLFEIAQNTNHSVLAPRAYWNSEGCITGTHPTSCGFSSGLVVIKPRNGTRVDALFKRVLWGEDFEHLDGDMDWFNDHLSRGGHVGDVDNLFVMLAGEFYPKDRIYGHFQRSLNLTDQGLLKSAPLVHFVADWKPWLKSTKQKGLYKASAVLVEVLSRWNRVSKTAC